MIPYNFLIDVFVFVLKVARRGDVELGNGMLWKETVGILEKRLDLAVQMKDQAISDSKLLQNEIGRQDERLKALYEKQQMLKRMESAFEQIMRQNVVIRKSIHQQTESLSSCSQNVFDL